MKRASFPGAAGLRGSPPAAFAQQKRRAGSKDHGGNFSNVPETLHFLPIFTDLSASFCDNESSSE